MGLTRREEELFKMLVEGKIREIDYNYELKKAKFQEGVRVRGIKQHDGKNIKGKVGTIRYSTKGAISIGVEFDEHIDGHDLNGKCKSGFGWWVTPSSLEIIEE